MSTKDMYAKAAEIFFTKDQDISPLINMGMNENSAKDTIRCYNKLIKGEYFNRNIQQEIIRVFLEELFKKNDKENLAKTLYGLYNYFEIRLKDYGMKNKGSIKIADEYKKKLSVMDNGKNISYPDEIDKNLIQLLQEGAKKQVIVNAYERNLKARSKCINNYGTSCFICGFNFEQVYGEEAKGFIHVHHIKPLSEIGENYVVDPTEDLRPLCPNCHAFVHLSGNCKTLEEVQKRIK